MAHQQVMDVVIPDGTGWIEIGLAFVAAFLISFLWWGMLMGRQWAIEMGMDPDGEKPPMAKPMLIQALGTFLFAYVLWHVMYAFTVVADHNMAGDLMMANISWSAGMAGAFYTWLGFFVPAQLGAVAWEERSWKLAAINGGGHLITLVVLAAIFVIL